MAKERPPQHVTGERGVRLVKDLLPDEWIVRELPLDYGVDLEIEIVDETVVSGNRIWAQVRGTETRLVERRLAKPHPLSRQDPQPYFSFSVEFDLLDYALKCGVPLLLFVADLDVRDMIWIPLRDEIEVNLDNRSPRWREQAETTVRLPTRNSIADDATRDFEDLRWMALEPARMLAFSRIQAIHHDLGYDADLSYFEYTEDAYGVDNPIGLDSGLEAAEKGLKQCLPLESMFRDNGSTILGPNAERIEAAANDCPILRREIFERKIDPMDAARRVADVQFAINSLSTAVANHRLARYCWITATET